MYQTELVQREREPWRDRIVPDPPSRSVGHCRDQDDSTMPTAVIREGLSSDLICSGHGEV